MLNRTPVALTIAGSDPSGGAGIQADLKTFHQFGAYGEAVITLITVQNSLSVSRVDVLDPVLVRQQLEAVLGDIPPLAIKTGALGNRAVVENIAEVLNRKEHLDIPLILDPVLAGTSGMTLLDAEGRQALLDYLFPRTYLLMPNLNEAALLAGFEVANPDSMRKAAKVLHAIGPRNILIKGGHLEGDAIDFLLAEDGSEQQFSAPKIATRHTHGTGCTYSAAITAELANGKSLLDAILRAKTFVYKAIQSAPGLGGGYGPLNHFA